MRGGMELKKLLDFCLALCYSYFNRLAVLSVKK